MQKRTTRRGILKTAGVGAGAGLATVVFREGTVVAAAQVPGGSKVGQVVRHEDDMVDVVVEGARMRVPTEGFPDGWRLRKGDRVVVAGSKGPFPNLALPLVTRLVGKVAGSARAKRAALRVGGTEVRLRKETIQQATAARSPRTRGPLFEAYIIENTLDGAQECVAFRPTES